MSPRTALLSLSLFLLPGSALAHRRGPTPIAFQSASCFNVDLSSYPQVTFHGPEVLDISPFGPTLVDWSITALLTPTGFEFVEGTFALHVRHKLIFGEYTGFTLDPITGEYFLDWSFTGGTGRFHRVTGSGQTHGFADLTTFCAEYSFTGELHHLPRWW